LHELSRRAGSAEIGAVVADAESLRGLIARRGFDTHKGDYGRVGIIAGSPGMLGAAALCADACVRGGAGLVTLYATADIADRLSMLAPREVMVRSVQSLSEVPVYSHDVLAIGPGLGAAHAEEIVPLVRGVARPMVIDADGLNGLARDTEALIDPAGEWILTPHPGEMARLAPQLADQPRAEIVRNFLHRFPKVTLLLKGARTIVAAANTHLVYNSTGTPGMATGGMGDVLTGVIAALLGQGLRAFDAGQVGAWLCGRAGELAIDGRGATEETLTPTVLLDHLDEAFRALRSGDAQGACQLRT
jgi:NAD(P)H-hydrate epimerase